MRRLAWRGARAALLWLLLASAWPIASPRADSAAAAGVSDRQIVVVHRASAAAAELRSRADRMALRYRHTYELPSIALAVSVFEFGPGDDGARVSAALSQGEGVIAVDLNRPYTGFASSGFLLRARSLQRAIDTINAGRAAEIATGRGVRIALIDGGVDERHLELQAKILARIDLVGAATDADPALAREELRHATGIAGIVLAERTMTGLAPDARMVAIKAFALKPGEGGQIRSRSDRIARAIDVALRLRARVINMSFGGPRDRVVGLLVQEALARGVVIVAAAGDHAETAGAPIYPAAYPGVIAVAAAEARGPGASYPPHVALAAPGLDVLTTAPGGGFQTLSGSSIAAAHVTGAVALLAELRAGLTPGEAAALLLTSAQRGDSLGAGLIDVGRALELAHSLAAR